MIALYGYVTMLYIPQIAFKCFVIVWFSRHFCRFLQLLCINTIHFNQKSAFWIIKIKYPRPTKRYQTKLYISHLVKIGSSKFYIFVDFFLTFPFGLSKIVCGMVYAAAVWVATAFHDNRQMPGFSRQIGSIRPAVRLMALILHIFLPNSAVIANETA